MKKTCIAVQRIAIVLFVISAIVAGSLTAAWYVCFGAMVLAAVAAIVEPKNAPACPVIFTKHYQEQFKSVA